MKLYEITKSKNDEFYTPNYAIEPIIKYIKKGSVVWCPFDNKESNFVKLLKSKGFEVVNTHIENGQDFFEVDIPKCDYIISNPPYSLKCEVIQRLFEINKPFAMLVGVLGIFESKKRFNMFKENNFEIMYLDKRVAYFKDFSDQKISPNPPFSSAYICKGILPKQIVFEEIIKK